MAVTSLIPSGANGIQRHLKKSLLMAPRFVRFSNVKTKDWASSAAELKRYVQKKMDTI
jgi:hypothetical protein